MPDRAATAPDTADAASSSDATRALAEALIARSSVTPDDRGCQTLIAERLAPLGFHCETIARDGVTNLWARRGTARPLFVFAGHTDVVPTGPLDAWSSDPFVPVVRDGLLYGRGAADMKSSIAAFVVATEEFLHQRPAPRGSIAFLITSDEEGPALHGTQAVCALLRERGEALDYCIVGEPSSGGRLGDTIKNGRRGTLSGRLRVEGIQGHIAYPQLARNPIHDLSRALAALIAVEWDRGNDAFPPTSFQVSNIHAGTGATNVIPGEAVADFNFRFSTESTVDALRTRVDATLAALDLRYSIAWTLGGQPFLTAPGPLSRALASSIERHCGVVPTLSTTGGTSDGRFISTICGETMEFGPVNATIHKIDECVAVADLTPLKNVYRDTLAALVA